MILERRREEQEGREESEKEREREKQHSTVPLIYAVVISCMYPDPGSNLKPWHIQTLLQPIELPSQAEKEIFINTIYLLEHCLEHCKCSINIYLGDNCTHRITFEYFTLLGNYPILPDLLLLITKLCRTVNAYICI